MVLLMYSKTAHIAETNIASQNVFLPTMSSTGQRFPSDISTIHNKPESPTSLSPIPMTQFQALVGHHATAGLRPHIPPLVVDQLFGWT